ncbi:MAG: hypothetical protein JWN35_3143 [Frankiales bacterium]|jgi:diguanylate cyclase (GGDEF)-like protein/PAS domain S-box-containing protein|nr:hypothetical protein [Frankiales bacterium]
MAGSPRLGLDLSDAQTAAVFADAPTAMAVVDLNGRYVAVNPALCRLLGRAAEDLVGQLTTFATHPDDRQHGTAVVRALRTGERQGVTGPKRYLRPDGTTVHALRTATVIPDEHGRPAFVLAHMVDVTEEKRARATLERRSARTSALLALQDSLGAARTPQQLEEAARVAAQAAGDAAVIWLLDDATGQLFSVAVWHDDEQTRAFLQQLATAPVPLGEGVTGRVALTGEPLVVSREQGWHADEHLHAAYLPWLSRFDMSAMVAVPLKDDGVVTGVMTLGREGPAYAEDEVEFVRDLAHRVGASVAAHRADDRVAAGERFHADVVESLPIAMVVVDRAGRITSANEAWRTLLAGLTVPPEQFAPGADLLRELLTAEPLPGTLYRTPARALGRVLQEVLDGEEPLWRGDFAIQQGDTRWFTVQVSALAAVDGAVLTVSEITDRKAVESRLAHAATHDSLTGLPNRAFLDGLLTAPAAPSVRGRRALLFLDLDQFKLVNDSYGHRVGDELLVAVADRLRACVRPGDQLVRFAGDEFVVVCHTVLGEVHAVGIAEAILGAFDAPYIVAGIEVALTVSVGIALDDDLHAIGHGLLADADTALFEAKARGRARHALFDAKAGASVRSRLELSQSLRHAIEDDELVLHYQPVVTLEDGRTVAVEALVRWQRPGHGLVPPLEFIALAEDTGLIVPLGRWVLQAAVRQAAAWAAAGRPLRVAVNVSPRQLSHLAFLTDVATALTETGLDPAYLQLELTETAVMDADDVGGVLGGLRRLGVSVAIDDFGTGHSSLARLKRLSGITTLKIDRSFIAGVATDPDDAAIVTAVLRLADALGLSVVAEGVETPEQQAWLRAAGCALAQGYLFSRPRPAAEIRGPVVAGCRT